MMVLLLAKKDKQPRNFHLNITVVYILYIIVRRYTDARKLLSERRNLADNKINLTNSFYLIEKKIFSLYLDRFDSLNVWQYQLAFIYHLGQT